MYAAAIILGFVSAHLLKKQLAQLSFLKLENQVSQLFTSLIMTAFYLLPIVSIGQSKVSIGSIFFGLIGEFSTLTVLLVITHCSQRERYSESRKLKLGILVAGVILYYSVLTYSSPDVYRWGYSAAFPETKGLTILLGLLVTGIVALPRREPLMLCFVVLAWTLQLQASPNLWDYLLDVPLVIYCGVASLNLVLSSYRKRTIS